MSDQEPVVTPETTPETTPEAPQQSTPPPTDPTPAPTEEPNWRDQMAGEDEAFRKQLERFNTPGDVAKSWSEMRKKMDSGEYKRNVPFNDEWSDEEKGQWRKENSIPDDITGYKLPEGLVLSDEDKPVVDRILSAAQAGNVPSDAVAPIVDEYFKVQAEMAAQISAEEKQFSVETEETLRTEWGPEYLKNKNMAEEFATQRFGDEVGKAIMEAGPDAVKEMAAIAREINPAMTVVPNSDTPNTAVADEIAKLKSEMATPAWNDTKAARYMELIEAGNKMKARGQM